MSAAAALASLLAASLLALLLLARRRHGLACAELRRQADAARAAAEYHARLIAHVSHELRTPMQAITGLLGVLDDDALPAEQRRQHLATLRGASDDLLLIVDGLLDTAQVGELRQTLRSVEFSPRAMLEQIVHLLGPSALQRGLVLRAELAPELPPRLRGDRLRMRQIVINLLGNAIKYTHDGHVELRASARIEGETAHLRIDISDTGPGLSAEARARLFTAFTRVSAGDEAGTGLGLAISKELAEALGGRLGVDSEVGFGSTFWFEIALPVLSAAPEPEPVPTDLRPRVLVADDDLASRDLLVAMLRRAGYAVDGVADGRAAVTCALARGPIAVILDVQLPDLDGPGAAREIRAVRDDIALIALTGHTEVDVLARCKSAGIDAVLIKPVKLDTLRATIARVIEGRGEPVDLAVIRSYVTADDPAFASGLIDVYLREAARDLRSMADAAERGDCGAVAQLAHRLKGSSAGFGARLLPDRCQSLYAAARANMVVVGELTALTREFERVKAALEAEQARLQSIEHLIAPAPTV